MSDVMMAPRRGTLATVTRTEGIGMIMLRVKKGTQGVDNAVKAATGSTLPDMRSMTRAGDCAVGWMSPDEYLLILPQASVPGALASLAQDLAGQHHLAVDVSDARAVFHIAGLGADEVVTALCPVDMARLAQDELRRTRAAQVAAALWRDGDGITLATFRSVARYTFDLLSNAARA